MHELHPYQRKVVDRIRAKMLEQRRILVSMPTGSGKTETAIALARELDRPVQLSLSPAASQNHDRVAPAALARTGPSTSRSRWGSPPSLRADPSPSRS